MKFKRRSVSLLLSLCFVLSLLVAFKGEVKYVNAEENSDVYMITVEGTYGDNYSYASKAFFDEDFDSNGNVTFRAIKASMPDPESKDFDGLYDNKALYLYNDDPSATEMINNHGLGIGTNHIDVKYDFGEWITVNKSAFTYDNNLKEYCLSYYLVCDYKEQWVDGQYFDASGSRAYGYKGSWQGSGTSWWYTDASGWYPTSSWVMIDFNWYYFKDDGYAACKEWLNVNGSWYHFRDDCTYDWECWIDGYYINFDGVQSYGPTGSWKSDSNGWWFSDTSGWYPTEEDVEIDGTFYYFKADGYMAQNELIQTKDDKEYDCWSYFDENGQYVLEKSGYYDAEKQWHYYE